MFDNIRSNDSIQLESIFYFQKVLYMSEITRPYKYFYDFYSMFLSRKEEINAERKSSINYLYETNENPNNEEPKKETSMFSTIFPSKKEDETKDPNNEEPKKETSMFSTIFPSKKEDETKDPNNEEPKKETSMFSAIFPSKKEDETKDPNNEEEPKKETSMFSTIFPSKKEDETKDPNNNEEPKKETSMFSTIFPSKKEDETKDPNNNEEPKKEESIEQELKEGEPIQQESIEERSKEELVEKPKKDLEEKESIFTFLSNSIFSKKEQNPKQEISDNANISIEQEEIKDLSDILEGTIAFYENRRKNQYKNSN